MAMNGCSAFPKAPASLEPHHQCHIQDTHWGWVLTLSSLLSKITLCGWNAIKLRNETKPFKSKPNRSIIWWTRIIINKQTRRCPGCNGYCRRKWTRQREFKSWTRFITFHIALIPLGKVWIQLFSLQLWVNIGQTRFFSLGEVTSLGEGKLWIQTCQTPLTKLT